MKEYKLSSNEDAVVNLYGKNVKFLRGTGATFSVVYGAIKHAEGNFHFRAIVFGDTLDGFENKIHELAEEDPVLAKFKTTHSKDKIVIDFLHGSTVTFTTIENLKYDNVIYDIAYVDSNNITERQRSILPCIASDYCAVSTFE